MSSSNGHQVSPSASAALVSVEGATSETPLEVNDSDVNIAQCHLVSTLYVECHYLFKIAYTSGCTNLVDLGPHF